MADNEKMNEIKDTARNAEGDMGTFQFAKDVKLKECRYCCVMIPKKAKICPNCKMPLKKKWKRVLLFVLLLVILAAAAAGGYCYWYAYTPAQETTAVVAESDLDVTQTEAAAMQADEMQTDETQMDEMEDQTTSAAQADRTDTSTSTAEETVELPQVLEAPETIDTGKEALEETLEEIELTEGMLPESTLPEEESAEKESAEETEEENEAEETEKETEEIEKEAEETEEAPQEKTVLSEASVSEISYKDMIRRQADYQNTEIILEVKMVSQVEGGLFDDNMYYLCTGIDKQGSELYYIVRDDRTEEELLLLEGDVLRLRATLFDRCKLSADLVKTKPTVPALAMTECELVEE